MSEVEQLMGAVDAARDEIVELLLRTRYAIALACRTLNGRA
jgi:hypothetical protein